jgi:hypothetical protein
MNFHFPSGLMNSRVTFPRQALLVALAIVLISCSAVPVLAAHGYSRGYGYGHGYSNHYFGSRFGFGFSYYQPYYGYYGYYPSYAPFYYGYGPYDYYPRAYYGPVYVDPSGPPAYRITYGDGQSRDVNRNSTAWLNLNIQPGDTSVYIDGQYAGKASEFGRDKKLLPVTPSDHTLRLQAPGYQSVVIDLKVNPLQTLDVFQRLQPGTNSSASPVPPGASNAPEPTWDMSGTAPALRQSYGGTQRTAQATEPPSAPVVQDAPPATMEPGESSGPMPSPGSSADQFGRMILKFDVAMDNAAVYIDGRFTGVTDSNNPEFIVNDVPPGKHQAVVTLPGYLDYQGNVDVKADESGTLNVVMRKSAKR